MRASSVVITCLITGSLSVAACTERSGRAARAALANSATATRPDSSPSDTGKGLATADCVRGEPEPILRAGASPAAKFARTGALSATEDIQLDDTTSLHITHSGCAHYSETYAFTIRTPTVDVADTDLWLAYGAKLLRALPARESRTSQLESLASTLTNEAAKTAPYTNGDPIAIPELATVSLSVKSTSDGVVLEITYDVAL
jgi:hypothetical protein